MRGLHFYTQSVQYAALLEGATLLDAEGEQASAERLRGQGSELEAALESYWDESRGYIGATRELEIRPQEPDYKDENLDTSVVLASLHAGVDRGILSFADERLLATAHALEQAFSREYAIPGAIGRFTDDVYFGGNPWYLTTAAFAELSYRAARSVSRAGGITVTDRNRGFLRSALASGTRVAAVSPEGQALLASLRAKGDGYLEVIRRHVGSQGEMSEQFDRDAGVPVSAQDLAWSYAAFLSAARERARGLER
jgi:glucoamylase